MVLIYFAFRKVNLLKILGGLSAVPVKWIILNVFYGILMTTIGSYRWAVLFFGKTNRKQVFDFTKSSFAGSFYSLFFPTGAVGDLFKWIPLKAKYPEFTKIRLFSSVFWDRFVGLTAFAVVALVSSTVAKIFGFPIPNYLYLLFGGITLGVIVFYIAVFKFDLHRIFLKFKKLSKFHDAIDFLKSQNKWRFLKCLLISFVSEFLWIMQVWFVSNIFGAGFTIWSVFVFLPVIALILLLPISIAGFGAREQLYLIFFGSIAVDNERILMVSAFMGILGIFNALLGGLITLIPDKTKKI